MKQIPQAFINDLLARCDLIELIEARVPLRKKGNNHVACCPFHDEKTPSFIVNANKQLYHCFGCGVGGNAISFLMEYDHLSFVEAIELLATQFGLEIPHEITQVSHKPSVDLYQLMSKASQYYQQQLRKQAVAIEYLKQRGLSGQIAKEFGVGYALPSWDGLIKVFAQADIPDLVETGLIIKKNEQNYYDRFRDRIMFPIRDKRGRVIGFGGRIIDKGEPKYLNSPETPIFHKGKELYGLYEAYQVLRELPRLLVVEGYMDVVALAQHGIRYAVATLGTAITSEHIKALFRATTDVVFCFDGDRAGQAAAWRALEVALPLLQDGWQIRFLLLPENEDPDSSVRQEGAEKFKQRIQNALSLADFLFDHLMQQADLNNLEGKARLAKLATTLFNQLPTGIFQHMLYERLANLVRMDVNALKNITQQNAATEDVPMKRANSSRSPMRHVIALLLQAPQLIEILPIEIDFKNSILPGSEILKQLIEIIRHAPELNTATLLEYWRDEPKIYKQLMTLATLEIDVPQAGLEQEFLGTVKRLRQLNQVKQIEQFTNKLQRGALTEQEKKILQELLSDSKLTDA